MKTLLLLRHGKSSWSDQSIPDHKRPLKKRGQSASTTMGKWMLERALLPDIILCSSALRAQQTLKYLTQSWEASLPTIIQPELYHCDVEQFVKTLRDCPIIAKAILIIGHNPGLEELVQALTNRTESISTATLVQIELDIKEWSEVSLNSNSLLVSITQPRELS